MIQRLALGVALAVSAMTATFGNAAPPITEQPVGTGVEKGERPAADPNVTKIEGQITPDDPIDPGHQHPAKVHEVPLKKGKVYVIDLVSTDFDSFLRLEDSKGKQLAQDDDGGGNLNSRITITAPEDDKYKIVATTFSGGAGKYSLTVKEFAAVKNDKVFTVGKEGFSADGNLDANDAPDKLRNNPAKVFQVKMEGGKTYVIDLISNQFDAYLGLQDSAGNVLAQDDDSGGNLNSRIRYNVANAGTYRLVATSLDNRLGAFTIRVREE